MMLCESLTYYAAKPKRGHLRSAGCLVIIADSNDRASATGIASTVTYTANVELYLSANGTL